MDWTKASGLDARVAQRADDAWVARQWDDPRATAVWVGGDGRIGWSAGGRLLVTPTSGEYDPASCWFLGTRDGHPVFAVVADGPPGDGRLVGLRGVLPSVGDNEVEVAFMATALASWHRSAGFCPACGAPTRPVQGGHARVCGGCSAEWFPRLDPAVIVAVTDADDRIVLGRQPSWEPGRLSVFAGFVEAGESLEQAVHREIAEEIGLRLDAVSYFGSQPWPFPRSVMLAFRARTSESELRVDANEIEQARWFAREQLRASLDAGEVSLPPSHSIARRLIGAWLAG